MKIDRITLSGVDETVDPGDLLKFSRQYGEAIEYGVLLDPRKFGSPRYPGTDWINELLQTFRFHSHVWSLSLHLCGPICTTFILQMAEDNLKPRGPKRMEGDFVHTDPYSFFWFNRIQLNFPLVNERRLSVTCDELHYCLWRCMTTDAEIILQMNPKTRSLFDAVSPAHRVGVLHDASRGTGKSLLDATYESLGVSGIPQPVPGVSNGYAGGIGPDNIKAVLGALQQVVPMGWISIDMESSLRNGQDEFDLGRCAEVVEAVIRG